MKRLNEILAQTTASALESPETSTSELGDAPDGDPCPICDGAGFLHRKLPLGHPDFGKSVPCQCVVQESTTTRVTRLQRYSSIGPLTRLTFSNLLPRGRSVNPRDQDLFSALVTDAMAFCEEPNGWIIIHGPSGAGKTHVAAAIANRCIELGRPALFVVVPDLLDHLRSTFRPTNEVEYDLLFDQIRNAPLLILDDLGTENSTAWAQEKLFQIFNHRYNAQLPTVITTNAKLERIEDRLKTRLTDVALSRVYHVEAGADAVSAALPDSASLDRVREMTFENFELQPGHLRQDDLLSLEMAFRTSMEFSERPDDWLLLVGANGCGKTHLAAAISNRCLARGERPVFFFVPDLSDYLRQMMAPESGQSFLEAFNQLRNVPLMILDDFGSQSDYGWVRDRIYQIVYHRYVARLPTVLTVSRDSLGKLEERILARLYDPAVCVEVPITAPAYRIDFDVSPNAISRMRQSTANPTYNSPTSRTPRSSRRNSPSR